MATPCVRRRLPTHANNRIVRLAFIQLTVSTAASCAGGTFAYAAPSLTQPPKTCQFSPEFQDKSASHSMQLHGCPTDAPNNNQHCHSMEQQSCPVRHLCTSAAQCRIPRDGHCPAAEAEAHPAGGRRSRPAKRHTLSASIIHHNAGASRCS